MRSYIGPKADKIQRVTYGVNALKPGIICLLV